MKIDELILRLEFIKKIGGNLDCFAKQQGKNPLLLTVGDIVAITKDNSRSVGEGVYFISWDTDDHK